MRERREEEEERGREGRKDNVQSHTSSNPPYQMKRRMDRRVTTYHTSVSLHRS